MTSIPLVILGALAGTVAGAGMLLAWSALTPRPGAGGPGLIARVSTRGPAGVCALIAGLVAGAGTGWVGAGLAAAVAGWHLPAWAANRRDTPAASIARLDAIATWTESVAATLSSAAGLEQALRASARSAPAPIAGPARDLTAALDAGAGVPAAVRAFAHRVNEPAADLAAATLILAATSGAASLAPALELLAHATREDVRAAQAVQTGRASTLTDVRLVLGISASAVITLVVLDAGFLSPYDSPAGQVVLALIAAMVTGCVLWLRAAARIVVPPRVVNLHPDRNAAGPLTRTGASAPHPSAADTHTARIRAAHVGSAMDSTTWAGIP